MKRLELFEFEDFNWLPKIIRTGVTNLIVVFHKMTGTSDLLSKLILDIRKTYNFSEIVDYGSGSGGPMIETIQKINAEKIKSNIKLRLTDINPNPSIIHKIENLNNEFITYHPTSVNAINSDTDFNGLRTMIASFHHMDPKTAKSILLSAMNNKQPILIYEFAKNTIPILAWWLFLPLSLTILIIMTIFMTPFVRPLTFGQLFFTYIIPIIPLVYAWDGQASLMRTYSYDDIKELIGDAEQDTYNWTIEDAKNKKGKTQGYYILGLPST